MTTTAKIATKGTSSTGITEELAKRCHDNLGKKVLAVVELVAEARAEKRNGDESVVLNILTIEPAPNTMTEDHLRELARSFHYERQLADGQLRIETGDDLEPKVTDVLAAGAKHRPHTYVQDPEAIDGTTCNLCGADDQAPLHSAEAAAADPFASTDEDPDDDEDLDDLDIDEDPDLGGDDDGDDIPGDEEIDDDRPATNPFAVA
ncbi:hypothetical protein NPS01_25260 [Nocardioides psychrotolerans]|uniref:Uncharacterized protein n=1 Tax=Nocardioides psychrotolerans TaxID=1005945 RepID=A0A1I3LMM9_9ACTN|nr:hypothetical protein [Nocardioides psychrotolerans]GEP38863.1 hypothetical protein NPS01_25260 [Nocardioides psychrotolerans]SFI85957.1 hypothetical protein SAMN05216561_11430 [Nocardioides psychrotolerans]